MRLTATALMMIVLLFFGAVLGCAANQETEQPDLEKLMNPAEMNERAPDKFKAVFDTSQGKFTVEVNRSWAPKGADRFYNLVKNGFYNDCRFFRVVPNFMVQFGINGNPKVSQHMRVATIKDDPVKKSNERSYITYAMAGPNSRTSQLFINFADNSFLDDQGFSPFGKVTKGMDVVDSIQSKYGEKPAQARIQMEGNAYLEKTFPDLDFIKTVTIVAD